jgi:hypothetical protein
LCESGILVQRGLRILLELKLGADVRLRRCRRCNHEYQRARRHRRERTRYRSVLHGCSPLNQPNAPEPAAPRRPYPSLTGLAMMRRRSAWATGAETPSSRPDRAVRPLDHGGTLWITPPGVFLRPKQQDSRMGGNGRREIPNTTGSPASRVARLTPASGGGSGGSGPAAARGRRRRCSCRGERSRRYGPGRRHRGEHRPRRAGRRAAPSCGAR